MKTSSEESSAFYATCWGSEDSAGSDKGEIEGVGCGWGWGDAAKVGGKINTIMILCTRE